MKLQVKVPKEICLKQKIVEKYTYLYKEFRRFYPERKDYTYRQLRNNIAEVGTIVSAVVDTKDLRRATFLPWLDRNWCQLYYKHWYFAVEVVSIEGMQVAVVRDAHYEGDHHNDILLSAPYE